MRSLQVKFSALLIALLVLASFSIAWLATHHERRALEVEVEKRGRALARSLAGAAKEPLLDVEQGDYDDELTLDRLIGEVGLGNGVIGVRLLSREGRIAASLQPGERGSVGQPRVRDRDTASVERTASRLRVAAPVLYGGVRIGEAQVELDLRVLVDPVVEGNTRQLTAIAVTLVCVGVGAGIAFVTLLVGPLRRLRVGVERLRDGDLSVRVPPTSQDEVGELTRAFNEMGDSLQQKERIQSAFGRYVNDYVLNQLLAGPEDQSLSGIEREVSVLFCDVRGFTLISEGMKAHKVVALLNEVFQLVADCILERGGTIDKFIGDSVMAYFGSPVPDQDHATAAVSAAVDIQRAMKIRNRRSDPSEGAAGTPVELGIGIHTGLVVVGNIGSDRRTDFTAIGDAVNVAHRLEKLARPGEILVSEAVQRRVRTAEQLRFEGERTLTGRAKPVHVYSVEIERAAEGKASDESRDAT